MVPSETQHDNGLGRLSKCTVSVISAKISLSNHPLDTHTLAALYTSYIVTHYFLAHEVGVRRSWGRDWGGVAMKMRGAQSSFF